MRVKTISRIERDFTREVATDRLKVFRNYDPALHPFERPREYTRALNAVKLDRMFAKPFVGALDGHSDGVSTLSTSAFLSGASDGEIRVWDLPSRKCLWSCYGHRGSVRGLVSTPSGDAFYSCSEDKTVKLWSLSSTGNEEKTEPITVYTSKEYLTGIDHQAKKDTFATSSSKIQIWNCHRSEPTQTFSWGADHITCVRFNPADTSLLASTGSDRSITLYDLRLASNLRKVVLNMRSNSLAWNPMEPFNFTVANEDHNLYTFDTRKLQRALMVHKDHVSAVMDIAYSPTGHEFVSGSYDRTVRIFNIRSAKSREIYHTKRMQRVFAIRMTADANFILSGSDDTNVRIWKTQASKSLKKMTPRERCKQEYNDSLKERYQHLREINRIAKHRHLPKSIKKATDAKRESKAREKKKVDNRRAHSKPGKVPYENAREEAIIKEEELVHWAENQLKLLSVDETLARYLIEILDAEGLSADSDVDKQTAVQNEMARILKEWIASEESIDEKLSEFITNLIAFSLDPLLLDQKTREDSRTLESSRHHTRGIIADIERGIDEIGLVFADELKASALEFIPGAIKTSKTLPESTEDVQEEVGEDFRLDFENEDTFFWSIASELVSQLSLKFPEVDSNRMSELLRLVGMNMDQAHAVLKSTFTKEAEGRTQVCRHYLQGRCHRSDCMFLHSTYGVTCRFWLRGLCTQDKECVFAHDFVELHGLELQKDAHRDYESEDEETERTELELSKDAFPSLTTAPLEKGDFLDRQQAKETLDYARAVSLYPDQLNQSQNRSGTMAYPSPMHQTKPSRTTNFARMSDVKRVITGKAVTAQYQQVREEAYQLACARNKCFMRATEAFRSNNKAMATYMSREGRDLNEKMKKLHLMAAEVIFKSRNPHEQVYRDRLMDLHGLHVVEAVAFLQSWLPQLAEDGLELIRIVTGAGHHSKGPQNTARLLPAVEQFLRSEGYEYKSVVDRKGHVGMLQVNLQS
ncbi:hypothetical protein ABG067_007091 [Albugo candida]